MAAGLRLEKTHKHPTLMLAGETLVLDLCGGLWLPEHRTLIVSDLHLEKGSSYAARSGQFLPPYDTRETLACLHEAVVRHDPARVVALGDSFHDARGPERMEPGDRALVAALQEGRDWVWIAGESRRRGQRGRRRPLCRCADARRPSPAPRAQPGRGTRRDCRASPSLRQGRDAGPGGAPPLLRHRRIAPGDAGLRRLCGRSERPRQGDRRVVREGVHRPSSRRRRVFAIGRAQLARD